MCKVSDNGVSTEDCHVCTCPVSATGHTPVESTVTLPNGEKFLVRKCSSCGTAC